MNISSEISNNPIDWYVVTDQVMGGKSTLDIVFEDGIFTLNGVVSTKNNGGFVRLAQKFPAKSNKAKGIRFLAKGNDEIYEFHTTLRGVKFPPWSYLSKTFAVTNEWKEFTIEFKDLKSNGYIAKAMKAKNIREISFAGYGRDFLVDISIKDISFIY